MKYDNFSIFSPTSTNMVKHHPLWLLFIQITHGTHKTFYWNFTWCPSWWFLPFSHFQLFLSPSIPYECESSEYLFNQTGKYHFDAFNIHNLVLIFPWQRYTQLALLGHTGNCGKICTNALVHQHLFWWSSMSQSLFIMSMYQRKILNLTIKSEKEKIFKDKKSCWTYWNS